MWFDLPFAQVSSSVEKTCTQNFSFPNPLSEPEELQSWGSSKILLSFSMWFDGHFWTNQQQQWCLPQFESILDGHRSRHFLPAPFRLQIENTTEKMFDRFRAFCTNTNISVADKQDLKQNFMATLCSFPPSMTYKERLLYKKSYNTYTVEVKQTKLGGWTDVGW
jgi:hypothetical protein